MNWQHDYNTSKASSARKLTWNGKHRKKTQMNVILTLDIDMRPLREGKALGPG